MCVSDSIKNVTVLSQPNTPMSRILPVIFQLVVWDADRPGPGIPLLSRFLSEAPSWEDPCSGRRGSFCVTQNPVGPAAAEGFHQEGVQSPSLPVVVHRTTRTRRGPVILMPFCPFQGISDDAVLRIFGKKMPTAFLLQKWWLLRDCSKKSNRTK